MDSRRLSLRARLIAALVLLILVVIGAAAAWSYHRGLVEAQEAQDGLLTRVAEIARTPGVDFTDGELSTSADQSGLVVEVLDGSGASRSLPAIPKDGLTTVPTAQGEQRVMVRSLADGRRIAVAQPIAVRQDAVHESLLTTVVPILLGAPLFIVVAWLVVTWALRPLEDLRRELERRDDGSLAPLPRTSVPRELSGFLDALEEHHLRASDVLEGQRRFAAEAAHELRTPVSAVSLQAEHLVVATTDAEREQREDALQSGLERLRALCEQLLVLGDETPRADDPAPLDQIAREVAGNIMSRDDADDVDIRWTLGDAAASLVPAAGTRIVLQNLVLNAVRHAGSCGPIEVHADRVPTGIRLDVLDHGPGIREPERALDAFHREASQDTPGNGLGLAITARTLERMGGGLQLLPREGQGSGTRARVTLPEQVASTARSVPARDALLPGGASETGES